MSETVHATIRGDVEKFKRMLHESSLDGETEHDDIYLNILEDRIQVLQQTGGENVLTYCTFTEDYFDEIELGRDVRTVEGTDRNGNEFEYEVGAEAILNVDRTETYLGFASEGGTVELKFTGDESESDDRVASYARAEGALEAWVNLPGSDAVLSNIPHWLPLRFNEDDQYCNPDGDPAPTHIVTNVEKVQTIIRAVDEDQNAENYPITVTDGEFYINIGDEARDGVTGSLGAQEITTLNDEDGNPIDVQNYYFNGFVEIFAVLTGRIELGTAPGGEPLAVVQKGDDGRTIRHVNGPVNQA